MGKLLEGVRVLDLSNVLSGPFCAYQLALQGAEVIKVELPGTGDLARQLGADPGLNEKFMGASFLAQNAGKKSLTINLKKDAGREVFLRLVATADVLLENFRPGVMERLGLGYEILARTKPGLIYCAISGYGQTGPSRDNPAYDQIIQGLSGMMSVTGDSDTAPLRAGYPAADTTGGMNAAFAIACALVRKARTGEGAFIDVSMLDAAIGALGWQVSNWLTAGVRPQPMGNENATASPSGTFRTGSDPLNIAANKQEQFEKLCDILELPHLISDERFARREARKKNRAALKELLEQVLAQKPAEHWEARLNQAGIPAGRVLEVGEALEQPQVRHRDFLKVFPDVPGVARPVTVLRAGFRISNAEIDVAAPPPELGQHTDSLLAELDYDESEVQALRAAGAI
jgi:crotonobetainyl-CoA:carnitine CoA-transferase CaiB-like acyl-CoA transferase